MERLNELELANAALEKEVEDLKKIIQAGKLNNDSGRIAENHKHLLGLVNVIHDGPKAVVAYFLQGKEAGAFQRSILSSIGGSTSGHYFAFWQHFMRTTIVEYILEVKVAASTLTLASYKVSLKSIEEVDLPAGALDRLDELRNESNFKVLVSQVDDAELSIDTYAQNQSLFSFVGDLQTQEVEKIPQKKLMPGPSLHGSRKEDHRKIKVSRMRTTFVGNFAGTKKKK